MSPPRSTNALAPVSRRGKAQVAGTIRRATIPGRLDSPLQPLQLLAQPRDLALRVLAAAGFLLAAPRLVLGPLLDPLDHLLQPDDQLVALQQHRRAGEESQ